MDTVADVIGAIESGHNPGALRFEYLGYTKAPLLNATIEAIIKYNVCSVATARMIYATSWGEFQIMGENLYDPNLCAYRNSIARYLVQSGDQFVTFNSFLFRMPLSPRINAGSPASLFKDPNLRLQFSREYNGPDNVQEYADKIKSILS